MLRYSDAYAFGLDYLIESEQAKSQCAEEDFEEPLDLAEERDRQSLLPELGQLDRSQFNYGKETWKVCSLLGDRLFVKRTDQFGTFCGWVDAKVVLKLKQQSQATTIESDSDSNYVLSLENKLARDYEALYDIYTDIEVDSTDSSFDSRIYRVWAGMKLLGCFYRSPVDDLWIVSPFYGSGNDHKRYQTPDQAQEAIVQATEERRISNNYAVSRQQSAIT